MEESAVEWLVGILKDCNYLTKDADHLFEEAKEMEKEIIRTAYLDGMDGEYNTSEQYYNEKFKSE